MSKIRHIDSFARRTATVLGAFFLLSACNGGEATQVAGQGKYEVAGDHAIGNADATVTIVEYASVVCGACANWHNSVYPDLKKEYVDTGKVRFVFREFPTSPANFAYAGFTIANCADEDRFFENISMQFSRQSAILSSANPRKAYEDLAKASGLSVADYEACLADEDWKTAYDAKVDAAVAAGVNATPTFFINGEKAKVFTIESFKEELGPLLGEPAEKLSQEKMDEVD